MEKTIDYLPDGFGFIFVWGRKPVGKFVFVSPSRNFWLFN